MNYRIISNYFHSAVFPIQTSPHVSNLIMVGIHVPISISSGNELNSCKPWSLDEQIKNQSPTSALGDWPFLK